jgi:hypothetical protein
VRRRGLRNHGRELTGQERQEQEVNARERREKEARQDRELEATQRALDLNLSLLLEGQDTLGQSLRKASPKGSEKISINLFSKAYVLFFFDFIPTCLSVSLLTL